VHDRAAPIVVVLDPFEEPGSAELADHAAGGGQAQTGALGELGHAQRSGERSREQPGTCRGPSPARALASRSRSGGGTADFMWRVVAARSIRYSATSSSTVACRSVVALGGLAIDGSPRQKSVRIEQYGSQDSMTNIDQGDRHELER
jgi:hypothetical protein